MKVYEIDPSNFGKYQHLLSGILQKPNMCGVFSEGCGHCQTMKPEWDKLKSKVAGTPGNGSLVQFDSRVMPMLNYPKLTRRVSGYPTILLLKNGVPNHEYRGERTSDDMYNTFTNHVSQCEKDTKHPNSFKQSVAPTIISKQHSRSRHRKKKSKERKRRNRGSTQKGGAKQKRRRRTRRQSRVKRCCCNMGRCSKMCICRDKCLSHCPCCSNK